MWQGEFIMLGKDSERVELYNNVIATCVFMYGREIVIVLLIIGALSLEDIYKIATYCVVFLSIYRELMRSEDYHQQMGKQTYQRIGNVS